MLKSLKINYKHVISFYITAALNFEVFVCYGFLNINNNFWQRHYLNAKRPQ